MLFRSGQPAWRSAELHSAVSRICNLQSVRISQAPARSDALPTASRRYSRVQLCATPGWLTAASNRTHRKLASCLPPPVAVTSGVFTTRRRAMPKTMTRLFRPFIACTVLLSAATLPAREATLPYSRSNAAQPLANLQPLVVAATDYILLERLRPLIVRHQRPQQFGFT